MNKKSMILFVLLLTVMIGGNNAMSESNSFVSVDFTRREGVPLLKKFALFNSGIVDFPQYQRDADLFDPLRVDSLRIDIFAGQDGRPFARLVTGTAEDMVFDFEKLDQLVCLLREHNVRPYWSWCYIPLPLQVDHDWRKGPSSLEQWKEMFRVFADHYRQAGLRIAYNEIYNEPDCGDTFFLGSLADYTQMYICAARGLKEGNPDAVIGGPSSAIIDMTGTMKIRHFLDSVLDADVPLDFFSFHSYGCDQKQYLMRTKMARRILSDYPSLDTTELHLNEYNSEIQPFQIDGRAEHSIGAATMLTSFELLLDQTDVTLAHWAQFMDTGYEPLGAISPSGRIKAPYWAYWMYSQMPEERVAIIGLPKPEAEGLHGMASIDADTACVLLWNDSNDTAVTTTLTSSGLPFSDGTLEIYEMNDAVDPYWNGNGEISIQPARTLPFHGEDLKEDVQLSSGGFIFYRFLKKNPKADTAEPIGEMIRKYYYFPERGKKSYSFFDETDQTVYLGMNCEYSSRSVVAVEWDHLPDLFFLQCRHGGAYEEIDLNTSFSVRVDYAVGDEYVKAVLYTFMPINQRRDSSIPWGTKKQPDQILLTDTLMTGKTLINLAAHAPNGWDGRAVLTYDMHSTGPETWVEIRANRI